MALDALYVGIQRKRVNWILDADIQGFFRQCIARLGLAVRRASRGRSPHASPDPKMVEGGDIGGWPMVGIEGRDSTRGSGDSPNAKDNFEFERRLEFLRNSGAR